MINTLKRFFCAPERWEDDYYDRIDGWRRRMAIVSVLCSILIIGGAIYMIVFNMEAFKYVMGGIAVFGLFITLVYFIYSVITGGR